MLVVSQHKLRKKNLHTCLVFNSSKQEQEQQCFGQKDIALKKKMEKKVGWQWKVQVGGWDEMCGDGQ